jgi:membrane dipeptidase
MAATGAPWVDVHAHPGRCFLAGLDAGDPLAGLMGGQDVAAALSAAREARMAAVTLSTVADLRVLALDSVKGLRVGREFAPDEAYADHRRQLAGIGEVLARTARRRLARPRPTDQILGTNALALLRTVAGQAG